MSADYRGARQRMCELAGGLSAGQLARPVPITPLWTVQQVLAHVTGVLEDVNTGNMEGAPREAWTSAQVARRAGKPVGALLEEWQAMPLPATPVPMIDCSSHYQDIRYALGLGRDPDDPVPSAAVERLRTHLGPFDVELDDYELFRARLGRRSEAQVRAYNWGSDPGPVLDKFFMFAPQPFDVVE